jgi:hypothetical protein
MKVLLSLKNKSKEKQVKNNTSKGEKKKKKKKEPKPYEHHVLGIEMYRLASLPAFIFFFQPRHRNVVSNQGIKKI